MAVAEFDIAVVVRVALLALGVAFLGANLRVLAQLGRFWRLRHAARLTWPGAKPPHYGLLLALGAILGVLVFVKLVVQQQPLGSAFGEIMVCLYYAYLLPVSLRIGRGLYENGIWTESGFVPYTAIGGLSWREERQQITLLVVHRLRRLVRRLVVPHEHYAEVRRVLRDRIAAHDIEFTLQTLDVGSDGRDRV